MNQTGPVLVAFPIWKSSLLASGDKPERLHSLDDLLRQCAQFQAVGSIPNARWKDAVDTVNRALRRAWEHLHAPVYALPDPIKGQFYEHVSAYEGPSVATFARLPKKLAKLPDHPIAQQMRDFLTEITPVAVQLAGLKAVAVKRVAQAAPEDAAYRPPVPSTPAEKQVLELLEGILAESFGELVSLLVERNRTWVSGFLQAAKAARTDPTTTRPLRGGGHSPHLDIEWHFSNKKFAPGYTYDKLDRVHHQAVHILRASGAGGGGRCGEIEVKFAPATLAQLDQQAHGEAEKLKNLFLTKNLKKIASIIEAKGQPAQAAIQGHTVNLQGLQGTLRFMFPDGSAFTVQNSVVGVVNSHNTHFHRFPLTFHQVVLPNGVPMAQPSEERMNTVFVGAVPLPPAPPEPRFRTARPR